MTEPTEPWKWGEEPPVPKPEPFLSLGERHLCCGYDGYMQAFASGDWVRYKDYEALKAEFDEYKRAATIAADSVIDERNQLRAKVEWLTKDKCNADGYIRSLERQLAARDGITPNSTGRPKFEPDDNKIKGLDF